MSRIREARRAENAHLGPLNHDGRPWGVPREHVNSKGAPKPPLTREDAIGKALDYSVERALDPARRHRRPVVAYRCSYCGAWHVGTMKSHDHKPALFHEIGERAWWNLEAENGRRRLRNITRRARRHISSRSVA